VDLGDARCTNIGRYPLRRCISSSHNCLENFVSDLWILLRNGRRITFGSISNKNTRPDRLPKGYGGAIGVNYSGEASMNRSARAREPNPPLAVSASESDRPHFG